MEVSPKFEQCVAGAFRREYHIHDVFLDMVRVLPIPMFDQPIPKSGTIITDNYVAQKIVFRIILNRNIRYLMRD